jgi:hypothetical protein
MTIKDSTRRTNAARRAVLLSAIALSILAQISAHVVLYWARVQAFVTFPGPFSSWEPIVGSDAVVFCLPLLAAAGSVLFLLLALNVRPIRASMTSALLSFGGTCIALLIAFNAWGT